jgi:hypothetical protein
MLQSASSVQKGKKGEVIIFLWVLLCISISISGYATSFVFFLKTYYYQWRLIGPIISSHLLVSPGFVKSTIDS